MSRIRKEHLSVLCAILALFMVCMKFYSNIVAKSESVERVYDMEECYESWKEQLPRTHWVSKNFAEDITWIMVDSSITLKNIGYLYPDILFEEFGPDWMKPIWKYSSVKDYRRETSADTGKLAVGDTFTYKLYYKDEPVCIKLDEDVFSGQNTEEIADQLLQFSFFYSEDPSIAKMGEDGIVTAVGEGKTNVVIVHNGQMFKCPVNVKH